MQTIMGEMEEVGICEKKKMIWFMVPKRRMEWNGRELLVA